MVHVLDLPAAGNPAGEPRDDRIGGRQSFLDEKCRAITFEVGVGRQDYLDDPLLLDPLSKSIEGEGIGAALLQRRETAAEHVVEASENTARFESLEVLRLFDDTDDAAIAGVIAADVTEDLLGDVEAIVAASQVLGHPPDRLGEGEGFLAGYLQQMVGETFRALHPDARQTGELLDQLLEDPVSFRQVIPLHHSRQGDPTGDPVRLFLLELP